MKREKEEEDKERDEQCGVRLRRAHRAIVAGESCGNLTGP
jgi:hypothetical protein